MYVLPDPRGRAARHPRGCPYRGVMQLRNDIHHTDLGHQISDRVETIRELLADIQTLDIVADYRAGEAIDEADDHLRAAVMDIKHGESREANGEASFEDTPNLPPERSFAWAAETLHDYAGQTAITADGAFDIADAFYWYLDHEGTDVDLDADVDYEMDDLRWGKAIKAMSEHADDYRGIVDTMAYGQVVTVSDLSSHLLELVGDEPAEGASVGSGFRADGIHGGNMARLPNVYDYERGEWDDDESAADNGDEAPA